MDFSGEAKGTLGGLNVAALGDFVWEDCNGNGIQDDAGIPGCTLGGGIPNVPVELYRPNNSGECVRDDALFIRDDVTDLNGCYLFDDLLPGEYCVLFPDEVDPQGGPSEELADLLGCPEGSIAAYTTKGAPGSTSENDSNANPDGTTDAADLDAGETDLTIDAGLYCLASLGDTLWEDLNSDGIQDDLNRFEGEPGFNGIIVDLFDCSAPGTKITETLTADAPADPENPQIPEGPGWYQFDNLVPGCYTVRFERPSDFVFTEANQGGDPALDSNVDPNGVTGQINLLSGQSNQTIDAGVIRPLAGLGDFVFEDRNANGIQDMGEPGIPDVPVTLLTPGADGECNTPDDVSTGDDTVTSSEGTYIFEELEPGRYCVEFDKTDVACEFGEARFSPPGQGNPAKDSNPDPETGVSGNVDLAPGTFDPTIDAGIYCPAALGDRVWLDLNGDGIQNCSDTNGSGIIGDVVSGIPDTGPECDQAGVPGVPTALFGDDCSSLVGSTTTDADGFYSFEGLTPGADTGYCVKWTRPDFTECYAPRTWATIRRSTATGPRPTASARRPKQSTLVSNEFDPNWDLGLVETPPECDLLLDKQCRVETPPPPVFTEKCDGKIQEFTMVWPEDQVAVNVTLGEGLTDSSIGQSGTCNRRCGHLLQMAVIRRCLINITGGGFNGESKWHMSCSDKDMDADTATNEAQPQVSLAGAGLRQVPGQRQGQRQAGARQCLAARGSGR